MLHLSTIHISINISRQTEAQHNDNPKKFGSHYCVA